MAELVLLFSTDLAGDKDESLNAWLEVDEEEGSVVVATSRQGANGSCVTRLYLSPEHAERIAREGLAKATVARMAQARRHER